MSENRLMRFNDDKTVFVGYGDHRFGMIFIVKQNDQFSKVYLLNNNEITGEVKIHTDNAINIVSSIWQNH